MFVDDLISNLDSVAQEAPTGDPFPDGGGPGRFAPLPLAIPDRHRRVDDWPSRSAHIAVESVFA